MRSRGIAAVMFAGWLSACGQERPRSEPSLPLPRAAVPHGEGSVSVLTGRDALPLSGPRVLAEAGDYVLTHGDRVAVVSAKTGMLTDFGIEGLPDELVGVDPGIFAGTRQLAAPVVFSRIEEGQRVLTVVHRATELPVRLVTFFTFRGSALVIDSYAEPETPYAVGMGVGLGEWIGFGNLPVWVEGTGYAPHAGGEFRTAFVGRHGPGVKYALSRMSDRLYVKLGAVGLAGFFASARSSEFVEADASESSHRRVVLSVAPASVGEAYAEQLEPTSLVAVDGSGERAPGAAVTVVRCLDEKKQRRPYAVFDAREPTLRLPKDLCFEAQLMAPGRAATGFVPIAELSGLRLPVGGTLSAFVREVRTDGAMPVPSRLQVRGLDGTPHPSWGSHVYAGAAEHAAASSDGRFLLPLPVGSYRVIADRGFEYSSADQNIHVREGEVSHVALEIRREVDTSGYLSADLHLHAAPSPDAPQSLQERVRSLAAAGVEVGVATDHNRVTDYAPAIEKENLAAHVRGIVGDEVTTYRAPFGHFNVFPLRPGSSPLVYEHTGPSRLFAEARRREPWFERTLVLVNHPRMNDIGYFDVLRLDSQDFSELRETRPELFAFDALEVYNGDDASELADVRQVMDDWYALLAAGLRITATGNSDSHQLSFHEPGLPRTYVQTHTDEPARLDESAFVDALRSGRVSVSGGPFVQLSIDGVRAGGQVEPGAREIRVTVDAPSWMDVARAELVVDGKVVAETESVATGTRRIDWRITHELPAGSFVLAIASGRRPMDAVLFRRNVLPFAFTNPVFVRR